MDDLLVEDVLGLQQAGYLTGRREEYLQEEIAAGNTVVEPGPHELQVDIDSGEAALNFERVWPMFKRCLGGEITRRAASRSGYPKEHITVVLPVVVDDLARVCFQAILGSDGKRELCNWMRYRDGVKPVSCFIEGAPKQERKHDITSDS